MPKFTRADETVTDLAEKLIREHECFLPLKERGVKVDYLFAYPDYNETTGKPKGDAIKHQGRKALGLCRKISLKDRAKGMGDAEITVDWEWWDVACDEERAALLDHELYHIGVSLKSDDLGRPVIKLRKHDVEVGWFTEVARRHARHSQEQIQARGIMDKFGQMLWPEIVGANGTRFGKLDVNEPTVSMSVNGGPRTAPVPLSTFQKVARKAAHATK